MNHTNNNTNSLFEIVTPEELADLRDAFSGARPHPLSVLLTESEAPTQIAINTQIAANEVLNQNSPWISGLKKRLLDRTDPANAASALAEIRAHGALLEAGFLVKPGTTNGKPSPEFIVDSGDGSEVIIEVHAKQIDAAEQTALDKHEIDLKSKLDDFRANLKKNKKAGGVFFGDPVSITPLGKPHAGKTGDTITANAISRLCAIKAKEHQLKDNIANVLWLDFQDDYSWNLGLESDFALPLCSWNGGMVSGALWYAFYGWKEAPIMEIDNSGQIVTPMGHDGRFNLETKLSAVIASFPKATVMLEHPNPATPLSTEFRTAAIRLPWARAELSLCNWQDGVVTSLVKAQRRLISATADAIRPSSSPPA